MSNSGANFTLVSAFFKWSRIAFTLNTRLSPSHKRENARTLGINWNCVRARYENGVPDKAGGRLIEVQITEAPLYNNDQEL